MISTEAFDVSGFKQIHLEVDIHKMRERVMAGPAQSQELQMGYSTTLRKLHNEVTYVKC